MGKEKTYIKTISILFFVLLCVVFAYTLKSNSWLQKSTTSNFVASSYYLETIKPKVLFISNTKEEEKTVAFLNVEKICDYTKLPFKEVNDVAFQNNQYVIPSSVQTIFLEDATNITAEGIKKIVNFTAKGGNVIITTLLYDESFNYLIGLKKDEAQHNYDKEAKGILFPENFFPNTKPIKLFKNYAHSGFNKNSFSDNVDVLLHAVDSTYPVLISNKIGLGKVLFFNTDMELGKRERGLLLSALLSTLEGVPYPVANVSTIFLDDFPSPLYDLKKEPIKTEYNVTNQEFVNKIWWNDMLSLAKKYNLKYTATIIFDYQVNTVAPFGFKEWNRSAIKNIPIPHLITQSVLENEHELSLHGYNHVSYLRESWTQENIGHSLQTVAKKWNLNNYGELPVTYIPPTNLIDEMGVKALHTYLPSVKYLSSIYLGDIEDGGDREYDIDPYEPNLFDFPRVSSGYVLEDESSYLKESTYLLLGVWSHFIHPDDVYQIPDKSNTVTKGHFSYRNKFNLFWKQTNENGLKGMYQTFDSILNQHQKTYPLTRFTTVKEAGKIVSELRKESYLHTSNQGFYNVSGIDNSPEKHSQDWFVYVTNQKERRLTSYLKSNNISFFKTPFQDGALVQIKTPENDLKIPLLHQQKNRIKQEEGMKNYLAFIAEPDTTYYQVEELKPLDLTEETRLLRTQILHSKSFNKKLWQHYLKNCIWQEKEVLFWSDFNKKFEDYPSKKMALFSDDVAKKAWYLTLSDQKKWRNRIITQETDTLQKVKFVKQYIGNFNTLGNEKDILNKLKLLKTLAPSKEHELEYVMYVMNNSFDEKEAILNDLIPQKNYNSIAEEMVWYFEAKKDYQKMVSWFPFADNITDANKLYLLQSSEQYQLLENYFDLFVRRNKEDDKSKVIMCDYYISQKKYDKAWQLASTVSPSSSEYENLRKQLNYLLVSGDTEYQKEILKSENSMVYTQVKDSLERDIMLQENDAISFSTFVNTDRDNVAFFDTKASYSIVASNKNAHTISVVRTQVNPLQNVNNIDNISKELNGLEYEFASSRRGNEKINYVARARVEADDKDRYYHIGGHINYNLDNTFLSLSVNRSPIRNGMAYKQRLYANKASLYFEKFFKSKLTTVAYSEYSFFSDDNYRFSTSLALKYPMYTMGSNILNTVLESTISRGSKDQLQGFPYFLLKERVYGGGGLEYRFNTDFDKTFILADAMIFSDSYSTYFSRFRARINFQLKKYLTVSFNGEYYLNNEYYSNSFALGISYYL